MTEIRVGAQQPQGYPYDLPKTNPVAMEALRDVVPARLKDVK